LRPVTYQFKEGHGNHIYTGFLAQEVEQALAKTGNQSFSGLIKPQNETEHYSLRYAEFTVPLVKAVQEQQTTIDALQQKVTEQQKTNELLLARLDKLEQLLANQPSDKNPSRTVELKQNVPNPSQHQTRIDYFIPSTATKVELALFDLVGKRLQSHAIQNTGEGSINLEIGGLSDGMYVYALIINGQEAISKKMLIVKE
jgi:trimeric autotransporter adhesin